MKHTKPIDSPRIHLDFKNNNTPGVYEIVFNTKNSMGFENELVIPIKLHSFMNVEKLSGDDAASIPLDI